ncbi:MAG: hypothetical protein AAF633_10220 [Chloroflexota bacterium]
MDVAADPLPERPTADANSLSNSSKRGSYLLLSVDDSDPDIISPDDDDWTVIQWQDNSGKWHAVDGWQGEYTYVVETNIWEVYWWVGEEHFGKGPFRWVVYTDATRETLEATSAPFDLPESRRDPVIISVRE